MTEENMNSMMNPIIHEEAKINFLEAVKDGFRIYRGNAGVMTKFAILLFLIGTVRGTTTFLREHVKDHNILGWLLLADLVLLIPLIYFSLRLTVAMYFGVGDLDEGKEVSFGELYRRSEERIGRNFKYGFLYGLMLMPFIVAGVLVFILMSNRWIAYSITGVLGVIALYLTVTFCFGPIAAVFENRSTSCFSFSRSLVKKHFWKLTVFLVIAEGLSALPMAFSEKLFPWIASLSLTSNYLIKTGLSALDIILIPLTSCILVVLYRRLRDRGNISREI